MAENGNNTSNRGFASMDENKRREIARKGGQNSHKGDQNSGNSGSEGSEE